MNIYEKLAKIRKPVEIIQKNKSGYGYKYVSEELILAKITGLMDKYKISLIPSITPGSTKFQPYTYVNTKVKKTGEIYDQTSSEIIVQADMYWSWIDNENPSDRVDVPWTLIGQQSDASQAFGSGLSYSSRYFMLKYFNVATSDDDPDNWRSIQKEAETQEDREISSAIIDQALHLINSHLEKDPDSRDEIIAIVKQYAKDQNGKPSTNPKVITDPVEASKLLDALVKKYGKEEN